LATVLGGAPEANDAGSGSSEKKRTMSAAGRARIAAAQKARWAKQKQDAVEHPAKTNPKKTRKLSPEGRARIIAATKARWAKVKGK
jgi:hypothetical protein